MESGTGDPVWLSELPTTRVAAIAALELECRILSSAGSRSRPFVYRSGPGPQRAAAAARRAIDAGADALVSWGLAAGLVEAAATGAVVLPQELLGYAGSYRADHDWRERIASRLAGFNVMSAPLISVDAVLTTAAAKRALADDSGAVAADMESAAIAEEATRTATPFVAIRVVADPASAALPDNIASLVTDDGRTRLRALPGFIVSPRRLIELIRLARASRRAIGVLEAVAATLAERPA